MYKLSYWVERNANRCDLDIIIFDSLSKRNYVKMNYKRCVNCPIGWNGMPTDAIYIQTTDNTLDFDINISASV